jgi:hypothetical protein
MSQKMRIILFGVVVTGIVGSLVFRSYAFGVIAAAAVVLFLVLYNAVNLIDGKAWNNGFCPRCGKAWVVYNLGQRDAERYFCPNCSGRGPRDGKRELVLCRVENK